MTFFLTPVEWGAAIFGAMALGALIVMAVTGGEPADPPIEPVKVRQVPTKIPKPVLVGER